MVPGKNTKHLLSLVIGVIFSQWIFGPDWMHFMVSSGVTYLLCVLFSRQKFLPQLVFIWAMGYMVAAHGYRMKVSYMSGEFDFTGTQMVLTMKLTSFAYNLFDGIADKKKVFAELDPNSKTYRRDKRVYDDRRKFAIESIPNPLEFFGYIFCFTCLLAGPAFEYNDYVRSIDGSAFKRKVDTKKGDPSSIAPALQRLGVGVLCLVLHLQLSGNILGLVGFDSYKLSTVYNKEHIAKHDMYYRYVFLWVALLAERFKYYFAWKVAEGSSVLAGFGFQGYDKDGKVIGWQGVENIDIVAFETASSVQILSKAWNKRTQGWLQRYTYHRYKDDLTITYFVSAIWHGLYPGFFFFFMSLPLMTNIERAFQKKINPIVIPGYDGRDDKTYPKTITAYAYRGLCLVGTTLGMNYVVQTFPMSSYDNCVTALGSFKFSGHIAFVILYVILSVTPGPRKEKSEKKQ